MMTVFRMRLTTLCVIVSLICAGCAATQPAATIQSEDTMVLSRGIEMPVTLVHPQGHSGPVPLVLLIHGHGGTRHAAGAYTQLAERLARLGIASVRMDFAGCGDSVESFRKNNLTTMGEDIRAAKAFALRRLAIDPRRVAMVGFSMGGRLAALESLRAPYRAIVMWAAALDDGAGDIVDMLGGEQAYSSMRRRAAQRGYVDFTTSWGQEQQLGFRWFNDMETSRPMQAIADYGGRIKLIHGSDDVVVLPEISARAFKSARRARDAKLVVIDDANHGFGLFDDRPYLTRKLLDETVTYLDAALR